MACVFLDHAVIRTTGLELSKGSHARLILDGEVCLNVAAPNFLVSACNILASVPPTPFGPGRHRFGGWSLCLFSVEKSTPRRGRRHRPNC